MRLGIGLRLSIVLAVFAVLAAGLTGYYSYEASRQALVQRAERDLQTSVQVLGRRFSAALGNAAKDVRLMADLAAESGKDFRGLTQVWEATLMAHPEYFQVRLIDADAYGLERIRVDRDGKRLSRVEGDKLQEKGHNLYVSDTLKLKDGQVYISKIFLNREEGAHSGFQQPTLLVASPVLVQGRTVGLAVINIDLDTLFRSMLGDLPEDFRVYLSNEWGDLLIHPDVSRTFGFERGQRVLIQDEFPAVAAIVAGEQDRVVVNSLESPQHAGQESLVAAFHKLDLPEFATPRFFILGLAEPLKGVLRDTRALGNNVLGIVAGFSFLAILLSLVVARAVTDPLDKMVTAIRRFRGGEAPTDLPLQRRDEIGLLARSFQELHTQISRQMLELQDSHREMERLAHHDVLTGLPNRATFFERLEFAMATARRNRGRLAVLFIDLDRFKEVNDQHGHRVGDRLLQLVAQRIGAALRESDLVARLSGDEFVAMLTGVEGESQVLGVAEKILALFREPLQVGDLALDVRVSIGISFFPQHGTAALALVEAADAAMYCSKAAGRNTCSIYQG